MLHPVKSLLVLLPVSPPHQVSCAVDSWPFTSQEQPKGFCLFISSAPLPETPSPAALIPLTERPSAASVPQIDFHTEGTCILPRWRLFELIPRHVIDDRREVGGSVELNRLKALMVSFEDALHAVTVGVLSVAILSTTTTKGSTSDQSSSSHNNLIEFSFKTWAWKDETQCTLCFELEPVTSNENMSYCRWVVRLLIRPKLRSSQHTLAGWKMPDWLESSSTLEELICTIKDDCNSF